MVNENEDEDQVVRLTISTTITEQGITVARDLRDRGLRILAGRPGGPAPPCATESSLQPLQWRGTSGTAACVSSLAVPEVRPHPVPQNPARLGTGNFNYFVGIGPDLDEQDSDWEVETDEET